MSRFYSYLNTAANIIESYKGEMPLSTFLKQYFSREKKFGSRDRKTITSVCYNYFRTGLSAKNKKLLDALTTGIFLCNDEPNDILNEIKPDWNEKATLPAEEKLTLAQVDLTDLFPFNDELSNGIDERAFATSFLIQPKVFVRVRPGKYDLVIRQLSAAQIDFEEISKSCLAFKNNSRLEEVLNINADVLIQDLNSQRVGEMLALAEMPSAPEVWDCCAASGGKSIMAHDLLPQIALTVSDVRPAILQNLKRRFSEAEIHRYKSFVADLASGENVPELEANNEFDLVICDAPCTGSGTWSRTPEQLFYFQKTEIERYSDLQKNIVRNTKRRVKKGGYFLYITCSVFKQENEALVEFIQQGGLKLMKVELLKGYELRADTMFAALFRA